MGSIPTGINPHLGGCQPWQKRGGRALAPMATDAVADLSDRHDRAARKPATKDRYTAAVI